jgi:hypothetical protein
MSSSLRTKYCVAVWVCTSFLSCNGLGQFAHAQGGKPSSETVTMIVLVKEADTGQPISQAHITLQFTEPGDLARFGKSKKIYYNAKTDPQGRCKFPGINKGTIVLTVTTPGRQTYGQELQLQDDNQVFEVKLKKPQPLI